MSYPRNLFISKAKAEKHTEKYISECLQYIDKLDSLNLPVIFDVRHLAILLDIDIQKLYLLSNNWDGQYAYFTISKRNGGKRRIIAPFTPIRNVQLWIKQNILDVIEAPQCVYAFVKGRSIVSNAKAHEMPNILRSMISVTSLKVLAYMMYVRLLICWDMIIRFHGYLPNCVQQRLTNINLIGW